MGRDTYSESYTSRQEIVPLDKSTQASAKESPPPWPGALISNGAAYRIRTYDVLIRSQTLYPAEVTPRLVDYYAHGLNNGQAFFQKSFCILFRIFYLASLRAKTQASAPVMPTAGADACQTTLLILQFFLNFLRCPRTARGSPPPRGPLPT